MYLKTIRSRKVAAGGCIQKHFDPSPRASACSPICREERSGRPSQTLPATLLCGGHLHLRGFIISTVNSPPDGSSFNRRSGLVYSNKDGPGWAGPGEFSNASARRYARNPLLLSVIIGFSLSHQIKATTTKARICEKAGREHRRSVSSDGKKRRSSKNTYSLFHTHIDTLSSSVHRSRKKRARTEGEKRIEYGLGARNLPCLTDGTSNSKKNEKTERVVVATHSFAGYNHGVVCVGVVGRS